MTVVALHRQTTPRLWLYLLGPMRATDANGATVLPRTRKARAVLAIIGLASPRAVSRDRITSLLWSRRERGQARASLRQCLHEIQGLLQPLGRGLIEADREQLRLAEGALWLDLKQPGPTRPGVLLEDLSGLDPAFDTWLDVERSRLAEPATAAETNGAVRLSVRALRPVGAGAEEVADGIVEELTSTLSAFRWIACLAPAEGSSGADSHYVLDGTVRRSGHQLRASMRVQDVRSGGEVIWTRAFTGDAGDVLAWENALCLEAAAQLDAVLLQREGARANARLLGSPSSFDLTLAAIPSLFRLDRDGFDRAGGLLDEAVLLAPDDPTPHAWSAYWRTLSVGQGWSDDPSRAMQQAAELAGRAVMLDATDARALTIAGHVRSFLDQQVDEALVLHERALAINPALPMAWMMSGLAHCYRGDHDEAIRRIEHARRLSPFDPQSFFFDGAQQMPHFALGDYERVVELGRKTSQLKSAFTSNWRVLLAALGHLERVSDAREARIRLLALQPGLTVTTALLRSPYRVERDRLRYAEGLRKGGLPE